MVIVSNGFNKFHLTGAAAELDRIDKLSLLITGAYPNQWVETACKISRLEKIAKFQRLLARKDDVDDRKVRTLWFPDAVYSAAMLSTRFAALMGCSYPEICAFALYGSMAAKLIRNTGMRARIYHYRAGFGGASVKTAKSMGMITVCDHSSVHPALFTYLVENGGKLPDPHMATAMNRLENWLLEDIEKADAVLVNSEFVKETFLNRSWPSNRIHTIYLGVDDQFMQYKHRTGKASPERSDSVRLLFAGSLERRKGAEGLINALQVSHRTDWKLEIAGHVHQEIAKRHRLFLRDNRVTCFGILPRSDVAKRMRAADVFLFPSLSEGSARVIFEAMACGCYIITTPNSGSIVKDGVHGALVPSNDTDALVQAIHWALDHRRKVREIGRNNAERVQRRYTQRQYGEELVRLYQRLLNQGLS